MWVHMLKQRVNGKEVKRIGDYDLDLVLALLERFASYGPAFPCWVESVWVDDEGDV